MKEKKRPNRRGEGQLSRSITWAQNQAQQTSKLKSKPNLGREPNKANEPIEPLCFTSNMTTPELLDWAFLLLQFFLIK
jgi:hypothetical protein